MRRDLLICAALAVATLLVYGQTFDFEFVNWDDVKFLSGNPHLRAGLGIETLRWAFASGETGSWQPITWISHLIDRELFGFRAGGHHATSVLLHVVNGLLVFALFWFGGVLPLLGAADRAEERVAMAEQRLEVMKRLRREYDEVSQRLTSVEERIRKGGRGNLRTNLERLAKQANVKIESMEPQASPSDDTYREAKVEVTLKQVGLNESVRYLHEIESAEEVLSVKALRMRSRSDAKAQPGSNLLDVTFTVSSFQPN